MSSFGLRARARGGQERCEQGQRTEGPRIVRASRIITTVLAAAAWLGAVNVAGFGPLPARAATPDLTIVTGATYVVEPDLGRVNVTVNLTATNHLVDTATTRYFYDQAYLAVQPDAAAFAVSGGSGQPSVDVAETKPTHKLLRIELGARLAAGASTTLRLQFELPDLGDPPNRALWVSRTLVTFPVWAFATTETPGSTVTVAIPGGYHVTFLQGAMVGPGTDDAGRQVWTTAPIDNALDFNVFIRAERPPEFVESRRSVTVGDRTATFVFRGWRDDPSWLVRTTDLYRSGVPSLAAAIGRPWSLSAALVVEEDLNPERKGIAGSFDPARNRIEVVYWAGPEVALHEAAHTWFNGGLLADRWANEAFASYYAEVVAEELGLPFDPSVVTPELRLSQLPLNVWAAGDTPPPEGADRSAIEAYGYAASVELARKIAERSEPAGLQRVWSAIADGVAPYQPRSGPTEILAGPPDWRGLLDLLEDDGQARVADMWRLYVMSPAEAGLLDERTDARRAYAHALDVAGDWHLPRVIRDALREWRFADAQDELALAVSVLDKRDVLATSAALAGLTLPTTLRERFEESGDLASAAAEADAEMDAVAAIRRATAARLQDVDALEWIGLLVTNPDKRLAEAVAALRAGDPASAATAADDAETTWLTAAEVGRARALAMGAGLPVLLVVGLLIRRRRSQPTPA